ncbi:MAG TPA: iron-sulfur cluster assembly protein [Mycobacteriales bacterium]|nr:iron-sulfur cluster assembly protein [Mycobacteriales bacterium]
MIEPSAVLAALATVRDPELDQAITALGFVASYEVAEAAVRVRLRLPTYFCAPNFAFLMVADAFDAVAAIPGVVQPEVVLDDHFASAAINDGVAARAGFARSFPDQAIGELDQLRRDFLRKAVLAGTDQVCRPLLAAGRSLPELARITLGGIPPSAALDRLRRRRSELGLPVGDDSPLLIDPVTGEAVGIDALPLHLRRARLTQVGVEANTSICRGSLRYRYSSAGQGEEAS